MITREQADKMKETVMKAISYHTDSNVSGVGITKVDGEYAVLVLVRSLGGYSQYKTVMDGIIVVWQEVGIIEAL
jgi:hypothetical protein